MTIIGLTGQTGAGKSYICKFAAEMGFEIIDCDMVSREVTAKGQPVLWDIAKVFGENVIIDGELDRRAVGNIVFNDKEKLKILESILFPVIIAAVEEKIRLSVQNGKKRFIIDAPTLYEAGVDKICSCVAAVTAPKELRLKRITARDGITEEQALARINSQPDDDFYSKADYIIVNDRALEKEYITELFEKMAAEQEGGV